MKFTRGITLVCVLVFAGALTACRGGGGKYSDLKPVVKKFNDTTETFINSMEKAEGADAVAAALNALAKEMKTIKAGMDKMEEKYPELKNMSDPPEELGAEAARMQELMGRMGTVMMKAMQFGDDPKVMEAQKAFEEAMK